MTRFQQVKTPAEVRALQQAGLLWWRETELAASCWQRNTDEQLQGCIDSGVFSILLEE